MFFLPKIFLNKDKKNCVGQKSLKICQNIIYINTCIKGLFSQFVDYFHVVENLDFFGKKSEFLVKKPQKYFQVIFGQKSGTFFKNKFFVKCHYKKYFHVPYLLIFKLWQH